MHSHSACEHLTYQGSPWHMSHAFILSGQSSDQSGTLKVTYGNETTSQMAEEGEIYDRLNMCIYIYSHIIATMLTYRFFYEPCMGWEWRMNECRMNAFIVIYRSNNIWRYKYKYWGSSIAHESYIRCEQTAVCISFSVLFLCLVWIWPWEKKLALNLEVRVFGRPVEPARGQRFRKVLTGVCRVSDNLVGSAEVAWGGDLLQAGQWAASDFFSADLTTLCGAFLSAAEQPA